RVWHDRVLDLHPAEREERVIRTEVDARRHPIRGGRYALGEEEVIERRVVRLAEPAVLEIGDELSLRIGVRHRARRRRRIGLVRRAQPGWLHWPVEVGVLSDRLVFTRAAESREERAHLRRHVGFETV